MDPGKIEGRLDLLCLLNGWKEGRFFTTVWADSPVPSLNQCTFRTDLPCTAAASADAKEGAFYFRERIGLDRMWVGCSCASRLDSRGSFVATQPYILHSSMPTVSQEVPSTEQSWVPEG